MLVRIEKERKFATAFMKNESKTNFKSSLTY